MIAIVVVALFFALITVERIGLYGVLKAIGASSGTLFAGVLLQALVVTARRLGHRRGGVPRPGRRSSRAGSIPFVATPARLLSSVAYLRRRRARRLRVLPAARAARRSGVGHRRGPVSPRPPTTARPPITSAPWSPR